MHYATRKPVAVAWSHGRIDSILPSEEPSQPGLATRWIAPPLFDLQINGYCGVDFQQDALALDDLLRASHALRRDGCGRFFFTLVTASWPRLMARLRHARELRRQSGALSTAIAGWHIEGPFLSDQPGFHGAHDPELMLDPGPKHIRELRDVLAGDPVLLTIAPERPGAIDAIALAVSLGMKVSLGHTNASAEVIADAVAAGATGFTHLANGCPRELDRHDNIIWRVCESIGLTPSFIPDGIHVSPAPFRLMHRLLESRKVYYTTDAMSAAGAGPGRYRLGAVEVVVGEDQIVRQPGQTNFAGSALKPIEGVFRASNMLSCAWQDCWRRASTAPAQFMELENELEPGSDFCLIEVDENDRLLSLTSPSEI